MTAWIDLHLTINYGPTTHIIFFLKRSDIVSAGLSSTTFCYFIGTIEAEFYDFKLFLLPMWFLAKTEEHFICSWVETTPHQALKWYFMGP